MMNSFLLKLSDEQLSLINAEDLDVQTEAAIEHFFKLKLQRGLISSEMVSAAIDDELPESLAAEILNRATKSPEVAELAEDFRLLKQVSLLEYSGESRYGENPEDARRRGRRFAPPPQASTGTIVQREDSVISSISGAVEMAASSYSTNEIIGMQEEPPPPLRDSILEQLDALEDNHSSQGSHTGFTAVIADSFKDLMTLRVAVPAFASLLVGVMSTSFLYQFSTPGFKGADTDFITRGETNEVVETEFYNRLDSYDLVVGFESPTLVSLYQNEEIIEPGGVVDERRPWSIQVLSTLTGSATLYLVNSENEFTSLDTKPAYVGQRSTFNEMRVGEQSSLDLRITIISEDNSTEVSYNFSYSVQASSN